MNTEASPQVIPVDQVVADHLSENTMRITRFFPDTFKPRGVVITRSHPVFVGNGFSHDALVASRRKASWLKPFSTKSR